METKFNNFLNEYGGPGKTIGFRYSSPSIDYEFSIHMVKSPELDIKEVEKIFKNIFDEKNVEEESMKFEFVGADEYKLIIKMKGYSKWEVLSMMNLVLDIADSEIGENAIFIEESVELKGKDIDKEPSPIGFKVGDKKEE